MINIKDISMKTIIDEVDIPADKSNYRDFLDEMIQYLPENVAREFRKLAVEKSGFRVSDVKDFLIDREEFVDKEAFVLMMLNYYKERKNKDQNDEKYIKNAIRMLEGSKRKVILVREKDEKVSGLKFVSLQNLTSNKKEKNLEKLTKLKQSKYFNYIMANVELLDLENAICEDKDIGEIIRTKILWNTLIEKHGYTMDELIQVQEKDGKRYDEIIETVKSDEYTEDFLEEIFRHPEEINIEKLLLVAAYRISIFLDKRECSENLTGYMKEALEEIINNLNETNVTLKTYIKFGDTGKINLLRFSLKDVKNVMKGFNKGQYLGEYNLNRIVKELLQGEIKLSEITDKTYTFLNLSKENLEQACLKNDENMKYAIQRGLILPEEVKEILMKKQEFSNEIIKYLYETKVINNEFLLGLYERESVTLENIMNISETKDKNINSLMTEEDMGKLYRNYVYGVYDKDTIKEYERLVLLYKTISFKEKSKQEIIEAGNELLTKLEDFATEENFKHLYLQGLIQLENVIDWGGQAVAIRMFGQKCLKPTDVKYLLSKGLLTMDSFRAILISNISLEDKLMLIYSTFDRYEDKDIRDELIQYIKIEKSKDTKGDSVGKRKKGEGTFRNEYETDPFTRWRLIRMLDKEYSQTNLTKDGYIIFKLPNQKNGTVILEKLFDEVATKSRPSYGSATYILREEDFIKNEDRIIENGQVQKSILVELREAKIAERIIHSENWGNYVKEYFGVKKESGYTKQEIEEIDDAILEIKKARTLRGIGE